MMSILDIFKKKTQSLSKIPNEDQRIKSHSVVSKNTQKVHAHSELINLLWYANGPQKNYTSNQKGETFQFESGTITLSFSTDTEPSLIDIHKPVRPVDISEDIERPPYYPTYDCLSPKQRGAYWSFLANPFNGESNIGFVFLFYYGLERHLLCGNFEDAYNVIIKLRDVYANKSFQSYSGNALVLSCIYHKRPDMMLKFIRSLDKEYELNFSDNLFLLSTAAFNLPINSKDVMRLAKSFEFEKNNYISKYPELFEEKLDEAFAEQYGKNSVEIREIISDKDLKKIKSDNVSIFANVSLHETRIDIPRLVDSFKLKKEMYDILNRTHEAVKVELAKLRKAGNLPKQKFAVKKKNELIFDTELERDLLKELKCNSKKPVDRHFTLISLQDFYYKYRDISEIYLVKCIEYCQEDIDSLNMLQNAYKKSKDAYNPGKGFIGIIPAFKRLAIIHEKKKAYMDAIRVCDIAIEYYNKIDMDTKEFIKRKNKLEAKCPPLLG